MLAKGNTKRELSDDVMLRQRIVELEAVEANDRLKLAALQQSHARLQVLYDIARAGLKELSAGEIARFALDGIRRLAPCQRIRIALFDFEARQARVWTKDAEGKAWSGLERMTESALADERGSRGLGSKMIRTLSTQGIRPCLSVPLVRRNETIGVLNIWSSLPTGLAPEQVEAIQEVADVLATALDQASRRERSAQSAPSI